MGCSQHTPGAAPSEQPCCDAVACPERRAQAPLPTCAPHWERTRWHRRCRRMERSCLVGCLTGRGRVREGRRRAGWGEETTIGAVHALPARAALGKGAVRGLRLTCERRANNVQGQRLRWLARGRGDLGICIKRIAVGANGVGLRGGWGGGGGQQVAPEREWLLNTSGPNLCRSHQQGLQTPNGLPLRTRKVQPVRVTVAAAL